VQPDALEDALLAGLTELPRKASSTIGDRLGINSEHVGKCSTRTRRRFQNWSEQSATAGRLLKRLPRPGETIHFLLDGSFVLASVIPVIIALAGQRCHVTLATLGLNRDTVSLLDEMVRDGRIASLRLAMSSYFAAADAATADFAVEVLKQAGAVVAVERVHAKIQLYAPITRPDRYVIETSANLRSCNCVEAAALTNDPKLYNWHDKWLSRFFDRFKLL